MRWIYAEVEEEEVLPFAREVFPDELRSEGYRLEDNPHITLIPRFRPQTDVEIPDIESHTISVSGYCYYRSNFQQQTAASLTKRE